MEVQYLWFGAPILVILFLIGLGRRTRSRPRGFDINNVSRQWLAEHQNRPPSEG